MGGQALGGVIVSIANILSLQASTPSASATAYFASSVVVLIACLASYKTHIVSLSLVTVCAC